MKLIYETLQKKHPVESIVEGKITTINDYAIYVKIDGFDIDGFLHANDLTYDKKPDEELKKYTKDQRLKVKILEIKPDQQKVRVGLKQTQNDPFEWFIDKKVNEAIKIQIKEEFGAPPGMLPSPSRKGATA